ncbi:MAG: LysE family transporter [Candidatus Caldarchaeales archaeon]
MGWETLIPMVVVVSASGVLSPGPLTVATVASSARFGKVAGPLVSTGHMIVEFPLVMLIAAGLTGVLHDRFAQLMTGVLGGAAVIAFGALGLAQSLRSRGQVGTRGGAGGFRGGPLIAGLLFTGLNPFFLTWWLTVGAALISEALALASIPGVVLMYASHIWMDYAWLTLISFASERGLRVLGSRALRYAEVALNSVLLAMGVILILRVFRP